MQRKTSLHDLPPEVLAQILAHLPNADLKKAAQVNHMFKALIYTSIQRELVVAETSTPPSPYVQAVRMLSGPYGAVMPWASHWQRTTKRAALYRQKPTALQYAAPIKGFVYYALMTAALICDIMNEERVTWKTALLLLLIAGGILKSLRQTAAISDSKAAFTEYQKLRTDMSAPGKQTQNAADKIVFERPFHGMTLSTILYKAVNQPAHDAHAAAGLRHLAP